MVTLPNQVAVVAACERLAPIIRDTLPATELAEVHGECPVAALPLRRQRLVRLETTEAIPRPITVIDFEEVTGALPGPDVESTRGAIKVIAFDSVPVRDREKNTVSRVLGE